MILCIGQVQLDTEIKFNFCNISYGSFLKQIYYQVPVIGELWNSIVVFLYKIQLSLDNLCLALEDVKPIFHCDTKYLRRGLALGNAPNTRILCWRYQHDGIFWRYLTLKFVSPLTPNLKFALPQMPTPDANQGNNGGVGPSRVGAGIGHVHFIFFCVDFIYIWWSTQTQYPVEYVLKALLFLVLCP